MTYLDTSALIKRFVQERGSELVTRLMLTRDLVRKHPLRGFDAIHLASALNLRHALDEDVTFAAADESLLRVAAAEHLQPLYVEVASES